MFSVPSEAIGGDTGHLLSIIVSNVATSCPVCATIGLVYSAYESTVRPICMHHRICRMGARRRYKSVLCLCNRVRIELQTTWVMCRNRNDVTKVWGGIVLLWIYHGRSLFSYRSMMTNHWTLCLNRLLRKEICISPKMIFFVWRVRCRLLVRHAKLRRALMIHASASLMQFNCYAEHCWRGTCSTSARSGAGSEPSTLNEDFFHQNEKRRIYQWDSTPHVL